MRQKVKNITVFALFLLLTTAGLAHGGTLSVQLGPEPCPPNIPDPDPSRVRIASGDFVRFHTSASCDFWVRGDSPIGEFRLGIQAAETERVVGPFSERLAVWHYWVVDGAAENDSAAGIVFIPTGSVLTQLGTIILVALMLASAVFIILRRRRAAVPA